MKHILAVNEEKNVLARQVGGPHGKENVKY